MHLGLCYNVNRLVTAGVWLLKRVRDAPSLAQMALSDGAQKPAAMDARSATDEAGSGNRT